MNTPRVGKGSNHGLQRRRRTTGPPALHEGREVDLHGVGKVKGVSSTYPSLSLLQRSDQSKELYVETFLHRKRQSVITKRMEILWEKKSVTGKEERQEDFPQKQK